MWVISSIQRNPSVGILSKRNWGILITPRPRPRPSASLEREREITQNAVKFATVRTVNFSHPDELAGFVKAQDNQIIIVTHVRLLSFALCTINVPAGGGSGLVQT